MKLIAGKLSNLRLYKDRLLTYICLLNKIIEAVIFNSKIYFKIKIVDLLHQEEIGLVQYK